MQSEPSRVRVRNAEPEPRVRLPGQRSHRLLKWFGLTTLGLATVLVVLMIAVPLLIDWNTFKPELVTAVRQVTGREVTIGRIEVRFRPLPTVSLVDVGLANPDGVDPPAMVTLPEARASLRLLPLISRELIIGEVTVKQPRINLSIDRSGKPNWRFAPPADAARAEPEAGGGLPFDTVVLEGFAIQDGTVTFVNTSTDERISVTGVDIEGDVDARGATPKAFLESFRARLELEVASLTASDLLVTSITRLKVKVEVPEELAHPVIDATADIQLRGIEEGVEVTASGKVGRLTSLLAGGGAYPFHLEGRAGTVEVSVSGEVADPLSQPRPKIDLEARGPTLAAFAPFANFKIPDLGPFNLKLSAELAGPERLIVRALNATVGGLSATASGAITDADTADPKPRFKIEMSGQTLAELRPMLGAEVPDLGPFSISAEVATAGQQVTVDDLSARLASSDLAGNAQITVGPPRPHVVASLTSDTLNLVEIQAAVDGGDDKGPGAKTPRRGRYLIPNTPLPFDALQRVDLDLTAEVATLVATNQIQFSNTALKAGLSAGRLTIDPVSTQVVKGGLKGTLTVDGSHTPASHSLTLDADQIRIGELLHGLEVIDLGPAVAAGSFELEGEGDSPRQIASSLAGKTYVSSKGGDVELGALKVLVSGIAEVFDPLLGGSDEIEIGCIVNSFRVEGGVMTSQVQLLSTTSFAVAGAGTIDLRNEELDLNFTTKARRPSLASFAVPFRVKGPFTGPSAYPDPLGSVFTAARAAGMVLDPLSLLGMLSVDDASDVSACEAAVKQAASGQVAPSQPGGAVDRAVEGIGEDLKDVFGN